MNRNVLIEFSNSISDDDLKFLTSRLSEKLQGDMAEALEFMSHFKQMDTVLSAAKSGDEVFDLCEQVAEFLQRECKKRGVQIFERR